ncbi:hypothetical protein FNW21_05555 [Flavobacterium restrictum]|uniref:Uncharacterized protein n=1 Tax=Flavobacterium restrictum TaxID=2594428 RepID=A0A553E6T4_9FLAO|nr:hypothetical protein FNW21_05555 [Flavobacterium restrictum]
MLKKLSSNGKLFFGGYSVRDEKGVFWLLAFGFCFLTFVFCLLFFVFCLLAFDFCLLSFDF